MERKPNLKSWMILLLFLFENIFRTAVNGATVVSIVSPSDSRVEASRDLILLCHISDFTPSSVRKVAWTKDNELFAWNGDLQGQFTSLAVTVSNFTTSDGDFFYSVYFTMVTEEDAGLYRCLVVEGTADNFVEVVSDTIFLTIVRPYPVCSHAETTYIIEGNQITITCVAEAKIAYNYPTLYWKNLRTDRIDFGVTTEEEYSITTKLYLQVTPELDDEQYGCYSTGTNPQSCTVGPFQVVPGFPEISPKRLTTHEGQAAEFTCTTPTSDSTIEWFTIPETHVLRTISLAQNSFSIANSNIAEDDGKTVVCKATIGEDILEDRAVLSVIPAPTVATTITTLPTTTTTTASPTTTKLHTTVTSTVVTSSTIAKTTAAKTTRLVMNTTPKATTRSSLTTPRSEPPAPIPDPTTASNAPSSETTNDSTTEHLETVPTKDTKPDESAFSDVALIAVGSAGGGFLIILLLIIIIASVCCCGRCNADGKDTDESGTTTQGTGSSYYSWEQNTEGQIPIEFSMDTLNKALNGSLRSSAGSHLSDTMRALPGGYRRTPVQSLRNFPGNLTPNGSLRGYTDYKTPEGSLRGYSRMSPGSSINNISGSMTPQRSRHQKMPSRSSDFSHDSGNLSYQGSFTGNSAQGSFRDNPAYTPEHNQYPMDTMAGFPGGNFRDNNNTMSTERTVKESHPVFDINSDEVPPVPPIRRESSKGSRRSKHSSTSFTRQPQLQPGPKLQPSRHGLNQQDSGYHEEYHQSNGRPPGWNSPGRSRGNTSLNDQKGRFGDYTKADDMLF